MQHVVSIIMPAFNAGRYVAESIRSVLGQACEGWELIVVDDGSTDDTADVVKSFAAAEGRVKYVAQPNGGQASARNKGLSTARGDLVAFLDADDLWLPEKLKLQVAAIDESGADVVFSDGYIFSDDPSVETDKFAVVPGKTEGPEMFRLLFERNRIATLSVLARRSVLDAAGLFDEDRRCQNCEDYDLWLRLARRGAVFFGMTEKLMKYRRHAGASTYRESRLLAPMLAVVLKHARSELLEREAARRRIRDLYRSLIAALVDEGNVVGARERMREFSAWDGGSVATRLQSLLLRCLPRHYNYLSRECLYRAEWHIASLSGKLKGA
jgi:teichuronic acid biosynthesis glycosyltransferase TuaG